MTKEDKSWKKILKDANQLLLEAVNNAYLKFKETLEDEGVDSIFYSIRIEARQLSEDFGFIERTLILDDLEKPIKKIKVEG